MTGEKPGHVWGRDEDGDVDVFAVNYSFHNGPRCTACGAGFCHHCEPERLTEPCPKVIDGVAVPVLPALAGGGPAGEDR